MGPLRLDGLDFVERHADALARLEILELGLSLADAHRVDAPKAVATTVVEDVVANCHKPQCFL